MRIRSKSLFIVFLFFLATPVSVLADENSLSVVAAGTINYKNLEFDVTDKKFKPNLMTFDLSFTGVYRSFYFSVNYDNTAKEDYEYLYDPGQSSDDMILTMSRKDAGLTLGYNFANAITLFGGYLDGVTSVYLQGNLLALRPNNGNIEPERFNGIMEFIMKGPYLGIGYTLPVGSKNSLSLNIAYADMDGSLKLDMGSFKGEAEGKSTGFSYGLSLSGPLTDSISYRIGLKANRYTFDHTSYDENAAPPNNDPFDHDQNFNIFYVGVSSYL